MNARERIIVALDVSSIEEATRLVELLKDEVGAFKVGLELLHRAGFDAFDRIRNAGAKRIFYDAKLHDIPNTVSGALKAAVRLGIWMINVHCSGGSEMMRSAAETVRHEAAASGLEPPKLIGVTVLTSIDERTFAEELRIPGKLIDHVVHLAKLSRDAGLDGVVASPREIEAIKHACGKDFLVVTPGVRPSGSEAGDQKRVLTPGEAIKKGADYIVVGRPITLAENPAAAARAIAAEMEYT